jgi:hypothetical protein
MKQWIYVMVFLMAGQLMAAPWGSDWDDGWGEWGPDYSFDREYKDQAIRYLKEALEVSDNTSEAKRYAERGLHFLRGPQKRKGGYKYAEWREIMDYDKTVTKKQRQDKWVNEGWQHCSFEIPYIYAIKLHVPKKWGLFHGNDPIKVDKIVVTYRPLRKGEREKRFEKTLNQILNPKDKLEFELPEIGKEATIQVWSASVKREEKKDCSLSVIAKHPSLKDDRFSPFSDSVDLIKEALTEYSTADFEEKIIKALKWLGVEIEVDNDPYGMEGLNKEQQRKLKFALFLLKDYDTRGAMKETDGVYRQVSDSSIKQKLEKALRAMEKDTWSSRREAEEILATLIE